MCCRPTFQKIVAEIASLGVKASAAAKQEAAEAVAAAAVVAASTARASSKDKRAQRKAASTSSSPAHSQCSSPIRATSRTSPVTFFS